MLIDESQWRVNLIGDWSVPFIREETKWRYKLYKNWLQFLDDGLGDGFDVVDEDFYEPDEEDDEYYDDEYSDNYDRNYQDRGNIRVSAAARGVDVEQPEETRKVAARDDENIAEDRPRRVPRERPPRNKAEAYDRWVRDRVATGDDWTDVEKEERSASRIMRKGSTGVGSFNGRPSRRPTDPRRWDFDDEEELEDLRVQGNFDFYGDDDQADRYYRDEDDIYRARRLRMAQMERARRSAWFDDNDRVPPARRDGFYDGSTLEEEDQTEERMYRKRYGSNDFVNVDGSPRRSNPRSAVGGSNAAAGGGGAGRFVLSPEEQRRVAAAQTRSNRRRRDAGFDGDSSVDNRSDGMSADEAFKEAWIASAERRPIGDSGLNSRSTSTRMSTGSSSSNSRPPASVETSSVAAVGGADTVASAPERGETVDDDDASAPVPVIAVTDKEI